MQLFTWGQNAKVVKSQEMDEKNVLYFKSQFIKQVYKTFFTVKLKNKK